MTDVDALLDEIEDQADAEAVMPRASLRSRLTRSRVGVALQIAGGASVSVAAFGFNVLVGWLTAGVALIVFGIATELEGKPSETS